MKKIILMFCLLFVVSCGSNQSAEIEKAKQELLQSDQGSTKKYNGISGDSDGGFITQESPYDVSNEPLSHIMKYVNIEDAFVFEEKDISLLSCESLTQFLSENYSWFYWNTCRDLEKEKSIYFHVLSLDGEKYNYERHYVNFDSGTYAKVLLEYGSPITSNDLAGMNQVLRDKEYENIVEYDKYFLGL